MSSVFYLTVPPWLPTRVWCAINSQMVWGYAPLMATRHKSSQSSEVLLECCVDSVGRHCWGHWSLSIWRCHICRRHQRRLVPVQLYGCYVRTRYCTMSVVRHCLTRTKHWTLRPRLLTLDSLQVGDVAQWLRVSEWLKDHALICASNVPFYTLYSRLSWWHRDKHYDYY